MKTLCPDCGKIMKKNKLYLQVWCCKDHGCWSVTFKSEFKKVSL